MIWCFMFLEKLTYDMIKNNIENYGDNRLKNLIKLAEFEDIKRNKVRSLLIDSMKINQLKTENTCWVNTDIFQKKLLRNIRLGREEKHLLNKLFNEI